MKKTLFAFVICIMTLQFAAFSVTGEPEHTSGLFGSDIVHHMDIMISEEDWADLQLHPIDKTKYKVDILIDGESVNEVSFATKGTSSLIIPANDPDNMRYSFRIRFDYFVEGQTWHTLREVNLQSSFADATYMKDYLCYLLFRKMDIPAPLAGYVWLTINGEDYGLYVAVENYNEELLDRYSLEGGSMYKPEEDDDPDSSGADMVYIDDNPDSYEEIFDNNVTKKKRNLPARVTEALKSLSEQEDLDEHLDMDEIARYFAVHNFVGNYDSYTGPKAHNYCLYEKDGKLALFPWDYNLAFGAFPSNGQFGYVSDSTWVVNQGIDTPLVCVTEDERPMWRWIVADEEYRSAYHKELGRLLEKCFDSGAIEKEMDELYEMLFPYVEKDPTAWYSPEEFETAYETLREMILLRAESVRCQLEGDLSTDTKIQSAEEQVDASHLSIKDMGIIEEGRPAGAETP